jgi:hypothetical protein
MNDTLQTLIRSVLKVGGGYMVAKGWADDNAVQVIVAGFVSLIAVIGGILHRTDKAQPVAITKLPLLMLAAALTLSAGCASSPQKVLYTTEEAAAISVDTAMTVWGDYVTQWNPPLAQQLQVKALYEKYQAAMLEAIDASALYATLSAGTNSLASKLQSDAALQQESAALADLVGAIRAFGAKL